MSIDQKNNRDYHNAQEVLLDKKLSREEKIHLLKEWARDEYQLLIADQENMLASRNQQYKNQLSEVLEALLTLDVEFDPSGAEG